MGFPAPFFSGFYVISYLQLLICNNKTSKELSWQNLINKTIYGVYLPCTVPHASPFGRCEEKAEAIPTL